MTADGSLLGHISILAEGTGMWLTSHRPFLTGAPCRGAETPKPSLPGWGGMPSSHTSADRQGESARQMGGVSKGRFGRHHAGGCPPPPCVCRTPACPRGWPLQPGCAPLGLSPARGPLCTCRPPIPATRTFGLRLHPLGGRPPPPTSLVAQGDPSVPGPHVLPHSFPKIPS